ncbi:MAG: M23 family metallopeptidase [Candidatus Aminicenantes bacterium]|nr:M23 family metallopeptidase [Candidatus Aminicenantes bacterium]
MGKSFLSLIIIPHTKSDSRTLSFSKKAIKFALWGTIVAGVFILGMTADYVRIKFTGHRYSALLSENQQQKETIKQYEGSIGALQEKAKSFENKIDVLNLMAGFKSPDKLQDPGVGDYPRSGPVFSASPPQISSGNLQNIQQRTDDIQKNLDTLANFFETQSSRLAATPSIKPVVGGLISSAFGVRPDPFTGQQTFHWGIDIVAAWGNPVIAPADGFVLTVSSDKFYGNSITLSHGLGVTTLYGHLSKIGVGEGQKVKRGDVIGNVGNTGKALGPHLHYEVHLNSKPVNPYNYLLDE